MRWLDGTTEYSVNMSLRKLWELVMSSNHLILCCPLLLLPSIFPSIRVFSNELALCIRWPKYWIFNFSISPFNEFSGLLSYRIDWFDLLAVSWDSQESSLAPQFESINSSSVRLLYGPTHICACYWKNHSFDCTDLFSKVMSLLFNMLSRLVTAFLPRSKCLLISWLQSPSEVILEPRKIKSVTVSTFPPSMCH